MCSENASFRLTVRLQTLVMYENRDATLKRLCAHWMHNTCSRVHHNSETMITKKTWIEYHEQTFLVFFDKFLNLKIKHDLIWFDWIELIFVFLSFFTSFLFLLKPNNYSPCLEKSLIFLSKTFSFQIPWLHGV